MDNHSENVVRTKDIISKEVKSPAFENLGTLKEIVLDKITGQARYVVLAFGGILGLGEDYFAFPWKAISYNAAENCFILKVSKDKLKKEYGFNKDHWPDMANWPTTVDTYYIF